MRPKKKEQKPADPPKDEKSDEVGGTNGESIGEDADWGRTVEKEPEVEQPGYGRPEDVGADDELI